MVKKIARRLTRENAVTNDNNRRKRRVRRRLKENRLLFFRKIMIKLQSQINQKQDSDLNT